MATIKSFTSLEQSRKLAEILPLESADIILTLEGNSELTSYPIMRNYSEFYNYLRIFELEEEYIKHTYIPAWSLAALLDVLPNKLQIALAINDFQGDRKEKYAIGSVEHDKYDCFADNSVDACYEMIIKLHELKLL